MILKRPILRDTTAPYTIGYVHVLSEQILERIRADSFCRWRRMFSGFTRTLICLGNASAKCIARQVLTSSNRSHKQVQATPFYLRDSTRLICLCPTKRI